MRGIRKTVTGLALLIVGGLAFADELRSPFEFPKAKPTPQARVAPPSVIDDYELRGVSRVGDLAKVYLFNGKEKKGVWLVVGERNDDGFLARNYDGNRKTVVVQHGTKTKTLTLARSKISEVKTAPVPVAAVSNPDRSQVGSGPKPPQQRVSKSDEEVRERMKKVAEEIRKRRQMRRSVIEEGAPDRR